MKKEEKYFVKSFEKDFVLKTLKGKRKVSFQSINDVLKTNEIKPNTKSFGKQMRLACSFLHKNYLKTYRSQGLIFQTSEKPLEVFPFDLALLTASEKIIVQYYRIKKNLHEYYGRDLIKGSKKFMFKTPEAMIKRFPSPNFVWRQVNKFRKKAGYNSLPKQKYKLVEYIEVIFNKSIRVKPTAIFGYSKLSRQIAKKNKLPHFISAKKFYESLK